jgi:hypothetical protein
VAADLERTVAFAKDAVLYMPPRQRPGEAAVWIAIEQLAAAGLLTQPVTAPTSQPRVSRRNAMRAAGVSLLVPLVESIVAPRAAEAASGVTAANCENLCQGIGLQCTDDPGNTCVVDTPGPPRLCRCR